MTERVCVVEGCAMAGKIVRGFCALHYDRQLRGRDLLALDRRGVIR